MYSVNFRCTAKWFSYADTYIQSSPDPFPIYIITEYWVEFPVLYSESESVSHSVLTVCNSMDCSPPGSSVHGILQARILEWVATPFSRGSSQARDQTQASCIAGGFFTVWATREALLYSSRMKWKYGLFSFSFEKNKVTFSSPLFREGSTFRKLRLWHPVPSLHGN